MQKMSSEEVKKSLVNILKEFDRYCCENGLRYCVEYGTLLGAVRHQGVIPWDGDIDVVMPRPDYEKFIELVKNKPIAEHIGIMDQKVSRNSFYRICDDRTYTVSYYRAERNNMPLWMDVFPVDGGVADKSKQLKFNRQMEKLNYHCVASYAKEGHNIIKRACFALYNAICPNLLTDYIDRKAKQLPYDPEKQGWRYCGQPIRKPFFEHYFDDPVRMKFEDIEVYATKRWDERLSLIYGNYMQLPPEDKRQGFFVEAYRI